MKLKKIFIMFSFFLLALLSPSVIKADIATDNLNAIANPGAHPENPIAQAELDDEDDNDNNQKTKEPTNNKNEEIKDKSNKGISFASIFFGITSGLAAIAALLQMIFHCLGI